MTVLQRFPHDSLKMLNLSHFSLFFLKKSDNLISNMSKKPRNISHPPPIVRNYHNPDLYCLYILNNHLNLFSIQLLKRAIDFISFFIHLL